MTSHKIHLADGESYVDGRSPEKARELLDAAEAAGLEIGVVKTTSFGYIVPSELVASDARGLSEKDENPEGAEFDPADSTIDEVKAYLDGADQTERERVLAAEETGKQRKGILELAATPEGDK